MVRIWHPTEGVHVELEWTAVNRPIANKGPVEDVDSISVNFRTFDIQRNLNAFELYGGV